MADVFKVVVGDELPVITLTLTDETTGDAIDLTTATSISVKFHSAGDLVVLSTITCAKVGTGSGGQATFNFIGGVLDVVAGSYMGDVVVDFSGNLNTVYNALRFRVRDKTA